MENVDVFIDIACFVLHCKDNVNICIIQIISFVFCNTFEETQLRGGWECA